MEKGPAEEVERDEEEPEVERDFTEEEEVERELAASQQVPAEEVTPYIFLRILQSMVQRRECTICIL